MNPKVAVITHVTQYAGPGIIKALESEKYTIVAQDKSFTDASVRDAWQQQHPHASLVAEKTVHGVIDHAVLKHGRIDVVVSNDIFELHYAPVDIADMADMRRACDALIAAPFSLISKAAPHMKKQGRGNIILITSASHIRPERGFSVYAAARAGASALARACSKDLAPYGISINAIEPNFLSSDIYYPSSLWGNEEGRQKLKEVVPAGRLGTTEEIGSVVAFLASGRADFINGQEIRFTGGWN